MAATLTNNRTASSEDMKARLKSSYDAIADTYNAEFTTPDDPVRLHYLNTLLEHLPKDAQQTASVLELGCGAACRDEASAPSREAGDECYGERLVDGAAGPCA